MRELALLSISAALINNLVLAQFFGIGPALTMSKGLKSAAGMGLAVTFMLVLASAATWAVNWTLTVLNPLFPIEQMKLVSFILVIVAIAQLVQILLRRFLPKLSKKGYISLITANSAILGVALLNIELFGTPVNNFLAAMLNGVLSGIGFLIVIVLLAAIRERLELQGVPKSFEGIPIALVSAALIAMAFLGLV